MYGLIKLRISGGMLSLREVFWRRLDGTKSSTFPSAWPLSTAENTARPHLVPALHDRDQGSWNRYGRSAERSR